MVGANLQSLDLKSSTVPNLDPYVKVGLSAKSQFSKHLDIGVFEDDSNQMWLVYGLHTKYGLVVKSSANNLFVNLDKCNNRTTVFGYVNLTNQRETLLT